MKFVKDNFQFIVILILFAVILLQRCGSEPKIEPVKPTIVTTVDTSWKHIQQPVINVYPTVSNHIPYTPKTGRDTLYLPSPIDSILRLQYKALRDSLLATNTYEQVFKSDSSSVMVKDTVSQNKIVGRSYQFNLKYPLIKQVTTIKEPYKPVNQLYVGGGLNGSQASFIRSVEAGLLLKNRKDQIYGVKIGIETPGIITYGVQSYWKIKLHR